MKESGNKSTHVKAALSLIIVLFLPITYNCAQGAPLILTNFSDYLTNRPWVSEMTYELSRDSHGFTTAIASVQPKGMYYRYLTNAPYRFPYTFGESNDRYWQLGQSVINIAFKSPQLGGSESNRLQTMCLLRRRRIYSVLNLGIDGLDNDKLAWTSQTEFTSPWLNWIGKPTAGTIHVKILSLKDGLPERIQCEYKSETVNYTRSIYCKYSKAALPPREIDVETVQSGEIFYQTNLIDEVAFGVRGDAKEGFLPTTIFPESAIPKTLAMESNGYAYTIETNGAWQFIDQSAVPEGTVSRDRKVVVLRFFLLIILVLPVIAAGCLYIRKSTQNNESQENI